MASITATVDGVSGSAPIVVKQPSTVTATPSIAAPGSTMTVRTTLPDPAGASPLSDVAMCRRVGVGDGASYSAQTLALSAAAFTDA